MTPSEVRRLFAYTEWANARLLDAVAAVSAEQLTRTIECSFSSIAGTLSHIVGVEWVWLRRWKGESPRAIPDWMTTGDLAALRAKLTDVERERETFLESVTDTDLTRRISYVNMKGEPWEYSLADMLVHVVNHSTYHRGQVVTLLRQVGASAPPTDFLVFDDVKGVIT
jgi:uncharacterized damage-inducible protein DinB